MATFGNFKNSYLGGRWNEQHDFFFLDSFEGSLPRVQISNFSEVLAMGNPAGKEDPF